MVNLSFRQHKDIKLLRNSKIFYGFFIKKVLEAVGPKDLLT